MIYIDANEANVTQPVGSNIFVQELIKNLKNQWSQKLPPITLLLSQAPKTSFFKNLPWPIQILPPAFFWTQWRLPLHLFLHPPKIIFTPGHYAPRFKPANTKSIITIFDLAFLHFPDQFTHKDLWQLKNWTNYSVKKAHHIITISKSTQKDLVSSYNLNPQKITIAYPGHRFQNFKPPQKTFARLQTQYKLKTHKYLLFVGTLQPRKNVTSLIQAFLDIAPSFPDFKLVLVGRPGWLFDSHIKPTLKPALSHPQIIWLDFVPDQTLATLYQNAYFLILPSLWEGFGMPVVEAASFGTPALVSNISSLTEIITDPFLHISSPFKPPQIKAKLTQMLKLDQTTYQKLRHQTYQLALSFQWSKTAQIIKQVLLTNYDN